MSKHLRCQSYISETAMANGAQLVSNPIQGMRSVTSHAAMIDGLLEMIDLDFDFNLKELQ